MAKMIACCKCRWIVLAGAIIFTVGCLQREPDRTKESRGDPLSTATAPASPAAVSLEPKRLSDDLSGLHNVIEVSEGLISGSEPEGENGFSSLAKLGVKTIISVDGARPDIDRARANGLRYIHIPIGYDGVPDNSAAALARAAREAEGPIYVHCHHGRHRGPAAAAIACIGAGKTQGKEALKILELAGTGTEYPGLWRDVEVYNAPSPDAPLPELFEVAEVESLTAAMASVDRHWDNVKLYREAKWETLPEHPDLAPAQEALLLREAFHEARRTAPADRFDGQFLKWLEQAEALAADMERQLHASDFEDAIRTCQSLDQACKQCHAKYRN